MTHAQWNKYWSNKQAQLQNQVEIQKHPQPSESDQLAAMTQRNIMQQVFPNKNPVPGHPAPVQKLPAMPTQSALPSLQSASATQQKISSQNVLNPKPTPKPTTQALTMIDKAAQSGDKEAQSIQRAIAFGQGALQSMTLGLSGSQLAENEVPALTRYNAIANQATAEHPIAENIGAAIGTLPSMAIGGGALAGSRAVTDWAGNNTARRIAAQAASGALENGAYTAASDIAPVAEGQKTPQQAIRDIGTQALVGGALGGALSGLGELASRRAGNAATVAEDTTRNAPEVAQGAQSEVPVEDQLRPEQQNETYQQSAATNPTTTIPNTESSTTETPALGAQNAQFPYVEKTSKAYANTYKNTDIFNQAEKDMLKEPDYKYQVTSEKQSMNEAQQRLELDFPGEVKDLSEAKSFNGADLDTAMGILSQYTQEARQTGDYSQVRNWSKVVQEKGTEAGQTVQAFAKYSRTPEGMAVAAQNFVKGAQDDMTKVDRDGKLVDNPLGRKIDNEASQINAAAKKAPNSARQLVNNLFKGDKESAQKLNDLISSGQFTKDDITDIVRKKYKVPTLDNDDMSKIMDYMQQSTTAKTEKEKFNLQLQAAKVAANKVPATVMDKLDNWRYLSMLGNLKTHARNIASNAVMDLIRRTKNVVGTAFEKVLPQAERTKAIAVSKPIKDFASKDFENVYYTIFQNEKNGFGGLIQRAKTIYKNPLLEKLRVGNNKALDYEDLFFAKNAYTDSLSQAMKARGLTPQYLSSGTEEANKALESVRAYATNEAFKATFREANSLSSMLNRLEKLNTKSKVANAAAHVLIGGAVPFKRTPLNILKRGVEYSPIGLIDGLTRGVAQLRKEEITGSQFVDRLSSGLTGTGLLGLGAFLAANNVLIGKDDSEQKEQSYNSMLGNQDYAINDHGNTFTIDWIGPSAMPLFAGVELYNTVFERGNGQNVEKGFGRFLSAMSNISDPLTQMSMLQGVNDMINTAKYSNNSLGAIAGSAISDYATQYIPTVSAQAARTTSGVVRSTKTSKDSALSQYGEQTLRSAASKIPGINNMLQPKVDLWGRNVSSGSLPGRVVSNFLSPGYYQQNHNTPVDNELSKVYSKTGDTSVLPSYAPNYIQDSSGKRYYLSDSEYTNYQRQLGQESYNNLHQLMGTSDYQNANNDEKVKLISSIYRNARADVKQKYMNAHHLQ